MNYAAIYERFISDRRMKEGQLIEAGEYCETHHVVPKSRGGSNDKQNLIRLTAEDHFFAHLLLAKIHGGRMWLPLMMMASVAPTRSGMSALKAAKMRKHYARARRALAREGNPLFNPALFDWKNLDTGETARLCLYDMHMRYGGGRPTWTSVASGSRKTYRGWTVADREVRIRGYKGRRFDFVNRDGRTFSGTQIEFRSATGVNAATATRVTRYQSVTRCGWRLVGVSDRHFNAPKDGGRPGKTGGVIVLVKDGQRLEGDRVELARKLDTTVGSISASIYQLRIGKIDSFKGYRLAS